MSHPTAGKHQASFEVIGLQIGHFIQDFCGSEIGSVEIKNVAHSNTHFPDTRTAAALLRVSGDALQQGSP